MEVIDVDRAEEIMARPGVVVLDVRTPKEFNRSRIAGSRLADWYREDFTSLIADLDVDTPTVIYCRSGRRSNDAMVLMDRLGFAELYDVGGGILAWVEAGKEVVGSQ